jgi:hypothetical protein
MGVHIRIQVALIADDGTEQMVEIAKLDREDPTAASLGLTLAEGKQVLAGLQAILVTHWPSGATAYLPVLRPHSAAPCRRHQRLQDAVRHGGGAESPLAAVRVPATRPTHHPPVVCTPARAHQSRTAVPGNELGCGRLVRLCHQAPP